MVNGHLHSGRGEGEAVMTSDPRKLLETDLESLACCQERLRRAELSAPSRGRMAPLASSSLMTAVVGCLICRALITAPPQLCHQPVAPTLKPWDNCSMKQKARTWK